ncbi:MAG: hypothetical protein HUJ29_04510 [Gammaproteobacteria bacterium]|nr:hypothetical protein [Gammaproteobacteria bacterium]
MKRLLLLVFCLTLGVHSAQAEQIEYEKRGLGTLYKLDGQIVNPYAQDGYERLREALASSPEAVARMDDVRGYAMPALVLSATGGALIGWPLGASIAGAEFDTTLFTSGLVLAGIGLWLDAKFHQGMTGAIDQGRRQSFHDRGLKFATSGNGLWFQYRF